MGPIETDPQPASSARTRLTRSDQSTRSPNTTQGGSGTVLSVNGETVGAEELWNDIREELSQKAAELSYAEYRTYVEGRAAQLIFDKIAEMLLYQRAALKLPSEADGMIDAYVDEEIRGIVATDFGGVERRYEKHLEAQGRTLDEVRESLRRQVVITRYLETEIKPKVPEPTRAELVAAFGEYADSLRRPPRRRMSLIAVRILDRLPSDLDNPTRDQWEAARGEALSLVTTAQTELGSGIPFAEVARRYSDGLHASEGGAWGWVTTGSVRERFEPVVDALYRLEVGEVSKVLETQDGFFLVRCDEIDAGLVPEFEDAQPELSRQLFRRAYNRLIMERVAELQSKAQIEPVDLRFLHLAVVNAAPKISLEGSP